MIFNSIILLHVKYFIEKFVRSLWSDVHNFEYHLHFGRVTLT